MDPIQTDRLVIRPVTADDEGALTRVYGDAELMRYITGRARTPAETRERLEKDLRFHETYGFGLCLADDCETGELVGRCGIGPRPVEDGIEGEMAWLVLQDQGGRGLGTEMARALIEFAVGHPDITRVFARAHPENSASIRIMENMGMRFVRKDEENVEYEVPPFETSGS